MTNFSDMNSVQVYAILVFLDAFRILDEFSIAIYFFQVNIEVTPTSILTGASVFVALWIFSAVVSAVDSVPLVRACGINNEISTSF